MAPNKKQETQDFNPQAIQDPKPRNKKKGGKGTFTPKIVFLLLLAILLALYGAGYLPMVDDLFRDVQAASSQKDGLNLSFELGMIALGALAVFIFLSRMMKKMQRKQIKQKREKLATGRPPVSEAEFVEMAAAHSVSAVVARVLYKELKTSYAAGMPLRLTDRFIQDLHWPAHKIQSFMWNLPSACGRKKHVLADPTKVHTVLEMLLYLEGCPGPKRA